MTREEAIKIFNTVLVFGKCDCPKKEIEECLKMAIKALEQPRWIPVTERLPEESGTYLVTVHVNPETLDIVKYGRIKYITTDAYYFKRENQWTPDDEWEDDEVIAWMPLPEPYKPESEVEE